MNDKDIMIRAGVDPYMALPLVARFCVEFPERVKSGMLIYATKTAIIVRSNS